MHGYPMYIQREEILDGYWTKPAHILSVLLSEMSKPKSQRLKWLWWFDADTVILNYKMGLETFLPPDEDEELRDVHILTTDDHNGLNNGIFAVRVSGYAVELFSNILAFRDMRPDTHLTFADQSAMEYVLAERKFAAHKVTVPLRASHIPFLFHAFTPSVDAQLTRLLQWFNAWPIEGDASSLYPYHAHPGDLLVHFPGMSAAPRAALMAEWCRRSERLSEVWTLPVAETGYLSEARRFWDEHKDRRRDTRQAWTDQSAKLLGLVREGEKTLAAMPADAPQLYVDALRGACEAANEMLGRTVRADGESEEEEGEKEELEELEDVGPADVDKLSIVMSNLEKVSF